MWLFSRFSFKFLEASSYSEDVDTGALHWYATKHFESYVKGKISCFDEILLTVLKFPEPEKKLIQEPKLSAIKLPTVTPGTSAAGERLFSSARHLKTWLPSRMGHLAVLNGHKRRTDSVSIADVTKDFVSPREDKGASPCILSWFLTMRIAREALALRTTSKSSKLRKVYLTCWLHWIV